MNVILTSFRFNPGHLSHIIGISKMFHDLGYSVFHRINHNYFLNFNDGFIFEKYNFNLLFDNGKNFNIIIFPSIRALFELLFFRLFTKYKCIYIYHEPFTNFHSFTKSGFSLFKVFRIWLISLVSTVICLLSHKVVLPSFNALNVFSKNKLSDSKFAKINLIFSDESTGINISCKRNIISYIGTIAEDHAFDKFVDFVDGCISNNLLLKFNFLIASSSNIPALYSAKINSAINSGRLTISCGVPLSNSEINNFYASSFIVWNAYRRSMQSGVLPKAYMFATPVIISESNESEFFKDLEHGALIKNQASLSDFINAINSIELNWPKISRNCRESYLVHFDYRALTPNFIEFINR